MKGNVIHLRPRYNFLQTPSRSFNSPLNAKVELKTTVLYAHVYYFPSKIPGVTKFRPV